MSDDLYGGMYDDDSTEQEQPSGNGLRGFAEAQKKENEELRKQLAEIQTERRSEKLADALKASGVNPRVADLIPAGIEPAGVQDWLGQYGELFGIKSEQQDTTEPAVSNEEQQALAALSGTPSGTAPVSNGDAAAAIGGIDNEADFWKAIRANQ